MIAIEFMLVISMLIVVFLVMLQYAVRAHAERIAAAAAAQGIAAAASYDGTAAAGQHSAEDYLTHLGPGLHETVVTAHRNGARATLSITGEVDQLIPLLPVRVHVHLATPIERFVPDTP